MTKALWQVALRAHRVANSGSRDHTRLMFVVCSESAASTELLAAFPTAYALQTLTQVSPDLDAAACATLEYGALGHGVRHVVVCGHHGCRGDGKALAPESSQALVVARCRALQEEAHTGPVLRRARVTMRALWFDESSHDVYACDFEGRPAKIMGDSELAAMFTRFDELFE